MKQYGMLKAIFMSFYSRKLYRDVAMNWGGYAFLYLLLIVALSWIVFTFQGQSALNQFYARNSEVIVAQVPVLLIKEGRISTPEYRPYIIMDVNKKERIAVIDITGKHTNLDEAEAPVLVTDTQIIMQTDPNEIKETTLPENLNLTIDPLVVNDYAKSYLSFAWLIIFPVMLLLAFIYRIVQVLLYSVLGKIYSAISGIAIPYHRIMFITMVALTPNIVISTILFAFGVTFPYQYLFYFLLTTLYMLFGIRANKGL